ncbi:MAG: hypothetical protein JW884_13470 [Deltaproteobacteria bacterium]|nr:hypothetical protein [Deltaproteobacteria bacterium]
MEKTHWSWAGLSFVASGLLAGICGMGGPPLVLWSMAHTWSSEKTRGFLFAVYVASIPIQIILLYFAFGSNILSSVMLAIIFSPFVYLGTLVGMPIGNRMSKDKLRGIAYAILMTLGISAAAPAALAYFR